MTRKMLSSVDDLIDVVREYPVIYDRINSVPGSNANDEKAQAWIEISEKLNEDAVVLKLKWRNLRDSYQKAVKNRRELEEIGQLHRYREYKHEEKMHFLYSHIIEAEMEGNQSKKRKGSGIFVPYIPPKSMKLEPAVRVFKQENSSDHCSDPSIEYVLETDINECQDEDEESMTENEFEDEENLTNHTEDEKNFCYISEELQTEEQKIIKYAQETPVIEQKPKTDFDPWLQSIKASMMKLTKLNQARAKRDINSILSNYEIEQLENVN